MRLKDAAFEQTDIHAVGPKIADEGDWCHERKGEKATFVLHMHETILSLEGLDLMAFLGKGNANLRALKAHFPKLRIVARGTELKAMGDREDLGRFEEVMRMVIWHVDRYNTIAEDDIDRLVKSEESSLLESCGTRRRHRLRTGWLESHGTHAQPTKACGGDPRP